jgi:hypothetical protein
MFRCRVAVDVVNAVDDACCRLNCTRSVVNLSKPASGGLGVFAVTSRQSPKADYASTYFYFYRGN